MHYCLDADVVYVCLDLEKSIVDISYAARGWTINKSPEKANALIVLYTSLCEESVDAKLYKIITKWMEVEEHPNLNLEEHPNLNLIGIQRRTVLFFYASTKSDLMLSSILKLSYPLTLTGGKRVIKLFKDVDVDSEMHGCLDENEDLEISNAYSLVPVVVG